jgi:hypothetical protein
MGNREMKDCKKKYYRQFTDQIFALFFVGMFVFCAKTALAQEETKLAGGNIKTEVSSPNNLAFKKETQKELVAPYLSLKTGIVNAADTEMTVSLYDGSLKAGCKNWSVLTATSDEANICAEETKSKKSVDERVLVGSFSQRSEFKIKKLGDHSFRRESFYPQQSQQQQDDNDVSDTMEGVMGKRPKGKSRIGGHVGFVLPLVARGGGSTSLPIADSFTIGFPVGLTVRTDSPVAFDFEFIPTINTPGRNNFFLTIHPGIIYGFKKKYAVGLRGAYDAGNASFGFTPLISRGFKINDKLGFFMEADFPVRWNRRDVGGRFASGAFAAHFGLAF